MATAPERIIKMSTTDTIPGAQRTINRSLMASTAGHRSLREAQEALQDYVRNYEFDAVVGVHFIAVSYTGSTGAGTIDTHISWAAYGTAIGYQ